MQQTMQTVDSREKSKQVEAAQREQRLIKFKTCCLTNVALDGGTPVVCDELGNLFAKEGLLAAMVDKTLPPEYSHIRGLRDVVNLNFHPNPDAPTAGTDVDWSTDNWAPYSCPIANVEMNGRFPFVALRQQRALGGSGGAADGDAPRVNVISEKAFKEVGLDSLQAEYGPFGSDDVIPLIPGDVERVALVEAMVQRRERERLQKADAKAKRKAEKRSGQPSEKVAASAGDVERSERKKAKNAASTSDAPVVTAAAVPSSGSSSAHFLGSVMSETAKSLAQAKGGSSGFAALFHGAGSQKPGSAVEQFIVQAGKRGVLD